VALSPAQWVTLLILGTASFRLVLAGTTGLGIDESYMVAAGRDLAWGYFDHPPASWWLSAGAAKLLGTEAPIAVRLPFIALFALTTWLMFRLAAGLFGARAGLWAAVTLNMAPVLGVTTATWVLPDGPLVAALLAFALAFHRALRDDSWPAWLAAGLFAGLALLAKYTAALTFAGALVALLTLAPRRLLGPKPWLAGLVALAAFTPVLAWNAANGWASFAFQGARAGVRKLAPGAPFATIAGEALFLLPWIWLPLALLWLRALRNGPRDPGPWLLAWLGFVPITLFVVISLWSPRVLYHWAAPGYLFAFPLLGAWVAANLHRLALRRALSGTAAFLVAGLSLAAAELNLNLLRLPADPLRQGLDWTPLRPALERRGLLAHPIAAPSWVDAGKLDYALGNAPPVACLNVDCRQFAHRPRTAADLLGQDVLLLAPRQDEARIRAAYAPLFAAIETLPPVEFALPGRPAVAMGAYLGRGLRDIPR
jgi:4-amino-4-deoxy-L-arabinose transferase-like glycosyltransferase